MMSGIQRKNVKANCYRNKLKIFGKWVQFKRSLLPYGRGSGVSLCCFGISLVVFFTLFLLQGPVGIMENIVPEGLMVPNLNAAETLKPACITVLYSGDERGTIQPCG
jgi:membrane protease YdiL (CAAX protease family)